MNLMEESPRLLKIFLPLLVFLILVLVGLNLALSRYGAFWRKEKVGLGSQAGLGQTASPTPAPSVDLKTAEFASPVEKKYLSEVKFVETNFKQKDLGFALPEGSPIYAVAEGSVDVIKGEDLNILILSSPQGGYFKYFFTGTAAIEKGTQVEKGEVLGKTGKGLLNMATGEQNLILSFFKSPTEGVSLDQSFVGKLK